MRTLRRSRLIAAAAVCSLVGAGLTAWSLLQVNNETAAQQQLVQRWRDSLPATGAESPTPAVTSPSPGPAPRPVPPVPSGRWFLMRVPGTGYEEVVREGVSEAILYRGPGHYPETAWPGWPGNVGVGVHNTYWLGVGKLEPGRTVVLETEYGVFTYRIRTSEVVAADTLGLFTQDGPQRLTLTTCWPLWAGAAATQRLVMVGDQVAAGWRIPWPPPSPTPTA